MEWKQLGILIRDGFTAFGRPLRESLAFPENGETRGIAVNAGRSGATINTRFETEGPAVLAIVNANRWVIQCPDCNGAEWAYRGEPVFMCQSCWNARINGFWRPVLFPSDLAEIESVLLLRPIPAQRNWQWGETPESLRAENLANGDPVPGPSGDPV